MVGGKKEVEGNSEFKKKMPSMLWNLFQILFHNTQIKRSHLLKRHTRTHTRTHARTHAAPPMNPEATRVLVSARLAASAVRAALLTPLVPFHRNRGSSTRSGY